MAMTVTATQGGSTTASLLLRVFVLTGAKPAASQTGASTNNQFSGATTWTQSITTTAGSNVYGAAAHGNGVTDTASNTTIVDSVDDNTNTWHYTTFKALNVTGAATVRGFTTSSTQTGPFAQLEILAATTLAEDASSPAVASGAGTATTSQTTASFTPPAGSLLVAIVSSNGGAAQTTMTVSGGGLTWTQQVVNNPSGGDYAGVWIADGPSGAASPSGTVQPRATVPVPRRRLVRAVWARITGQAFVFVPAPHQPPYLPPRRKLARAVWRGSAPFTGFVQVPARRQPPVTVFRRGLVRGQWRGGAGQAFVFVPAPAQQFRTAPRRVPARVVWRGGQGQAFVAVPAPPRLSPVPRRVPARVYWRGGAVQVAPGVAVPAPRQVPPVPRRRLARAYVQFRPVVTVNSQVVPVVLHPQPPRAPDDKSYIKKLILLS